MIKNYTQEEILNSIVKDRCPECDGNVKTIAGIKDSWESVLMCQECSNIYIYMPSDMGQTLMNLELIYTNSK